MMQFLPKDDHRQALRIKRFLMAFGTYIIWMLIALYCYLNGRFVRFVLPMSWIFTLIITTNLILFFLFRTGLNRRFKDPSLTMIQLVLATLCTMVFAYQLDEGRGIMLLLYMVVFTFGTFRLNFHQFIFLSIVALIGYGSVISLLLIYHPKSIILRLEVFYLITLLTVLVWFSFIGSYINELRLKLGRTNKELNDTNHELQNAIGEIKQLKGILPICAACKNIRDDKGYWQQVEEYVRDRTDAEFSHSICPECMIKLYPEFIKK